MARIKKFSTFPFTYNLGCAELLQVNIPLLNIPVSHRCGCFTQGKRDSKWVRPLFTSFWQFLRIFLLLRKFLWHIISFSKLYFFKCPICLKYIIKTYERSRINITWLQRKFNREILHIYTVEFMMRRKQFLSFWRQNSRGNNTIKINCRFFSEKR